MKKYRESNWKRMKIGKNREESHKIKKILKRKNKNKLMQNEIIEKWVLKVKKERRKNKCKTKYWKEDNSTGQINKKEFVMNV